MANQGPAVVLDGPIPAPPTYNLIQSAQVIEAADPHWEIGVALRRYPCGPALRWDPCSTGTTRVKATDQSNIAPLADYNPFVVHKLITCTTRQGIRDHDSRIRAAFPALETWAVENEYWTGATISTNPHLAQASATTIATGVSTKQAMAYADWAIGQTSQTGVIHANPFLLPAWFADVLITQKNGKLYSPAGNLIIPGGGYDFTDPSGANPNLTSAVFTKASIYVTGPLEVIRGDLVVIPDSESAAVDRLNNTITYRAERTYAVLWDRCLHGYIGITSGL